MFLDFAIASLVLVALPGPDQALIMRNGLVGGRTAGLRTMLGGASGLTLHASAAALGVAALLATSATAYATLKLVGIAYLFYLAWFSGLVSLIGFASDALRRPRVNAWTERVTGAALVAFGARLAASGRP